jgi:ABC-2 type transport system ATP-binding protein
MSEAPLLTITNGKRFYGQHLALNVEQLEIVQGDRILVSGPNGCGKSTLLQIVAGMANIHTGTLTCSERWRDLSIGYLPQDGGVYRDLTVFENQQAVRYLLGVHVDPSRSSTLVSRLGLSTVLHKRIGTLSGGFRRLAAIHALLSSGANVLVLDEPFESLDSIKLSSVREVIESFASDYIFILVSGHEGTRLVKGDAFWTKEIALLRQDTDAPDQA